MWVISWRMWKRGGGMGLCWGKECICWFVTEGYTIHRYLYMSQFNNVPKEVQIRRNAILLSDTLWFWTTAKKGTLERSTVPTLIKKKIKFSSYIRKFRRGQLQSYIWLRASSNMTKYLRISSYIRKPFLIYDFATDPVWISIYMMKI